MALLSTNFSFPGQKGFYKGKVRDVYNINDTILLMIATDRISAFDVVLPEGIPYKGQVLNQIASYFLDATSSMVPNWKIETPDPMVTAGVLCEPFKIEMVVRGYLTGHAWREYKSGKRILCGVKLPDSMREYEPFPQPIITPTTKADQGHDMDISREEIQNKGLVSKADYEQLESYTLELFKKGTAMASERGLILADTKYEFGKNHDKIYLIDEIHTPDSSRYFYALDYEKNIRNNIAPRQLSKEFVRNWLMENDFQGKPGQKIPEMTPEFISKVSNRYIELFEKITGQHFLKSNPTHISKRIEENCLNFIEKI